MLPSSLQTILQILTASSLLLPLFLSPTTAVEYGVDVSFPMHNPSINNTGNLLPDRQKIYDHYMEGCRKRYPKPRNICDDSEEGRVNMSLSQPKSMQNYTEAGYKKIKTPPEVWKLLREFWEKNNPVGHIHKSKPENWNKGNSYVNHWESPTYMISVEDGSLRGAGYALKDKIWAAAKDTLQEWTGEELQPCSLYGIRIYTEGAMLATHVDRLPLVSSAIVNVAQDVDEPWPIEVIGHDGKAHNVTMEPGDMVLYESHSILHGRPFALKGRYYANIFIHFEPTGHTLRHVEKHGIDSTDVDLKYREALKKGHGGHENEANHLPSYILKNSEVADEWIESHGHDNGEGDDEYHGEVEFTTGSTEAHLAAIEGRVQTLLELIEKKEELIHAKDVNGWTPLHEAARTGSVGAVKILVEKGAHVNEKTEGGETALYLAATEHGDDHPIVELLEELGGIFEGPEL